MKSFNTASGMYALQRRSRQLEIWIGQKSFNTASGMYVLQLIRFHLVMPKRRKKVSIPQAVCTRCNSVSGNPPPDKAKMANWKTSPVFSPIASSFGEHEFFFVTCERFYTSIYAGFRVHEKSGKPLFQLSFIIAGFQYNCQIAKRFSKIAFLSFSSYTGICFLKNASYF